MTATQTSPLVHYIRHLAVCGSIKDVPDGPLLERFVRHRDEGAFAALVRRHGPMVLDVCRRVLRDEHAAEDAFQATFLVLAHKAGSLRQADALGPWLHGVALRTSRRARTDAARRRERESRAAISDKIEDSDDLVWRDLRPILDDAIATLSDKYRVPFIRCYLEGETVAEVARQLGCPKGTIGVRLARAREHLRRRLSHRGVSLSLATLTAALGARDLSAAVVPSELRGAVTAAAHAAMQRGTEGVVFAEVVGLTKGALQMISRAKFKMMAFLLLSVSAATGGIGLFPRLMPAGQHTPKDEPQPVPAAAKTEDKQEQKVYQVAELLISTEDKLEQRVYQVTDLVQRDGFGHPTLEDKLIRLIVVVIAPRSWPERGGKATIDFHPLTMALVINQTPDLQDQIADLLSLLRRLDKAERSRVFVSTLIESNEGRAFLRRYLRAAMEKKEAARK